MYITGVRFGMSLYFLLGEAGEEIPSTAKEVKAYLKKASADKAVDYVTANRNETTVALQCAYGKLSKEDVETLAKPTGVTGFLRELDEASHE